MLTMATDERNFRSSYYDKMGFRGVEEKKSLEILLKEHAWDRIKLQQFCLRFTLPTSYRDLLWKVLLGILPVYSVAHEFVSEQRRAQVEDLERALKVMGLVDDSMPKSRRYLAMWHLETGRLHYEGQVQAECSFVPIAEALQSMYEDDVDVYWLAKGLYKFTESFKRDIPTLIKFTKNLLEKEDSKLYEYLMETKSFDVLPLAKWFKCCFAGVLDDSSLGKIWDKLCGGSPKILSFVAVVLLMTLRRSMMRACDAQQVLQCIGDIPDKEEVIANKAIEMWRNYGSMLPVQVDGMTKIM